ncbi:helix-turn-helix domain-containing protein [Spirosoma sp. BT702]|uniref:Helix-turn-helix domain-containing protein n=1 Tax=Spirosoma profusum TaxID=2771354 RepID=A0A927AV27_9BACT|nr:helix-turn-helix domain-containing protein [Spirosoma profusum]MBD2704953.1 helix-turn-helix domain-containing protein [Spirosoma profusum]
MVLNLQQILDDLSDIKKDVSAIQGIINQAPFQPTDDKPMSLTEAAEFLGIAEQTIYQNIRKVPHRKRFGRLYFFKAELLAYLDGHEINQSRKPRS